MSRKDKFAADKKEYIRGLKNKQRYNNLKYNILTTNFKKQTTIQLPFDYLFFTI